MGRSTRAHRRRAARARSWRHAGDARAAGAEITTAFSRTLSVRYKTDGGDATALTDPVSDADQRIEALVRDRLAERFPDHDIIGEEQVEERGAVHDTIWAVDPIDGTTNF